MSATMWGWGYVIGGTILIGVGGLFTTLGWNTLAGRDQQQNALRSLGRELQLNERLIAAALDLARRWPGRAQQENFSYEEYHSTQVTAAVTSGILDSQNARDHDLLESLESYRHAVADFNAALQRVGRQNPGLFIKTDLIPITDAKQWPSNVEDVLAQRFSALRRAHEAARAALRARNPSVFSHGRERHEAGVHASAA